MIFRAKLSTSALVMNGDIRSTINPWEIIVDTNLKNLRKYAEEYKNMRRR